jgi:hypothetical protein
LRAPDADIHIDYAGVCTTAYERGRFRRRIDYGQQIPGTLTEEERQWAAKLIAS